jgi:hypothetical protein
MVRDEDGTDRRRRDLRIDELAAHAVSAIEDIRYAVDDDRKRR